MQQSDNNAIIAILWKIAVSIESEMTLQPFFGGFEYDRQHNTKKPELE
ncbi:MAG: hypothetical protein IPK83_16540 [Planctomycetes bacterium]|nr:hypothetical protein [Planctomycetota bacterium]